jgi:hypothetical protein
MVSTLDLGPESADWTSAVGASSPGSAIFFRPGVYHGCDVSIPSGLVERGRSKLASCRLASGRGCTAAQRVTGPALLPFGVPGARWWHRRCCRGHTASGAVVLGVSHPCDSFGVPLAGVLLAATAAGASVIDCQHQSRHFILDNGVTGVRIDGLSLINGRVSAGEDAFGGCMLIGEDASLHLRNVTFRNCSAPGAYFAREREWGEESGSGRERKRGRKTARNKRRVGKERAEQEREEASEQA